MCKDLLVGLTDGGNVCMQVDDGSAHGWVLYAVLLWLHIDYRIPDFKCVIKCLRFEAFRVNCEFKYCVFSYRPIARAHHSHVVAGASRVHVHVLYVPAVPVELGSSR